MNEKLPATKNSKLTINKLFQQKLEQIVPIEELNIILATPPPANWIKVHPNIANHKYLPIDKVEYLLRSLFKKFSIEVKEAKQLLNSIQVTVRVHYLNPATDEMMFHDGVGAWELQTKAGTGILTLDMSNLNRGSVPMALGIAKSVAIKDACDHFGTLFGANLNRKDTQEFTGNAELLSYDAINDSKERNRVLNFMSSCKNIEDLQTVKETAITLGLDDEYKAKEVLING